MGKESVVVSSVDPSPLFLTALPYVSWLESRGEDYRVLLTPPVYPLWEWRGFRELGRSGATLVFIGDLLTPANLRRMEPIIDLAGGAIVATGPWCAGALERRARHAGLQVYEYRGLARAYGIPRPPEGVQDFVAREASRLFTVNRYLFARVLGGPEATEWAREAARDLMERGVSWLREYLGELLADAVNTVEDLLDSAECREEPWGHYAEAPLASLEDHALLAPAAARAARRSRKPVLAASRGPTSWHTAALYDSDAQGRKSRLAQLLERLAESRGGYATCGRYTVEVTARPDAFERIISSFREEARALAAGGGG